VGLHNRTSVEEVDLVFALIYLGARGIHKVLQELIYHVDIFEYQNPHDHCVIHRLLM